ncbi:hypothetical protein HELRODRAFT_73217 [Helobdella robusta]|uniref:60S ribosome subunit biogenesis protein NIP7 homolog n=1 Tax=Helobdella robusta TaxID=6412 RepID=T1G1B9_HELRO|nr:hypothetical protein HELRODRAFT_73217 [Helobdella robusta]ESO10239.1 hypothetical protein HELRODRAFT_73217 [Helobdella robusta]
MRPLTDEETKILFEKLSKYIGDNIEVLINRSDGLYCFRYAKGRVHYVSDFIMKKAAHFPKENLVSFGTCFGKFSKNMKFRLHITALDYLAPYAKHKVWVKPAFEHRFLSGEHILKSGLGRMTDNTSKYQGVIVYSMSDLPLGFGATAKSTADCRHADVTNILVYHQADNGEYLRNEESLI